VLCIPTIPHLYLPSLLLYIPCLLADGLPGAACSDMGCFVAGVGRRGRFFFQAWRRAAESTGHACCGILALCLSSLRYPLHCILNTFSIIISILALLALYSVVLLLYTRGLYADHSPAPGLLHCTFCLALPLFFTGIHSGAFARTAPPACRTYALFALQRSVLFPAA